MAVEVYLGDAPDYVKQWVENYYEKKLKEPMCFTAVDAGATIQLAKTGSPASIEIVYSTDKEHWNDYDFTDTVTLANAGDKVYFRAKDEVENDVVFFKNGSSYYRFKTTTGKRVAASGNLQTLMKADGSKLDISNKPNCYVSMFLGCTSLTHAPELPATLLADSCYSSMFLGCISLQQAPALPATTLVDSCYYNMFSECTFLNSIDVNFTAWDPSSATENWMSNAGTYTSSPVFTCPSALDTSIRDNSHIPDGWIIQKK